MQEDIPFDRAATEQEKESAFDVLADTEPLAYQKMRVLMRKQLQRQSLNPDKAATSEEVEMQQISSQGNIDALQELFVLLRSLPETPETEEAIMMLQTAIGTCEDLRYTAKTGARTALLEEYHNLLQGIQNYIDASGVSKNKQ